MTTSRKLPFVARHHLKGRSAAAAETHWHSYVAKFTVRKKIDQDVFVAALCERFARLFGADLNGFMRDSSDEGLAQWLLAQSRDLGVVRVKVETDGVREAVAP